MKKDIIKKFDLQLFDWTAHVSAGTPTVEPVNATTTAQYTEQVRNIAGKEGYPDVRNVFVMGGSDTAEHAVRLMPPDMHAKVFEVDYERAQHLTESIGRRAMIVNGDGRDLELLQDENITSAQAFLALTDKSESNILACLAAKRLGVRKTVAMIENSDYISMAESLDIGCIINKKTFAASHIYQMMLKADVTSIKTLTIASADVVEIKVAKGARITRHPIKDLGLPATVNLGGLVRNGKATLINGNTQVQEGDLVVAFCLQGEIKKLDRFFKPATGLFS